MEKKVYCPKCDSLRTRGKFRSNSSRKNGLQGWCRECEDANKKRWYKEHSVSVKAATAKRRLHNRRVAQRWVGAYLSEHQCVDCGESDIVVLDFDHVKGKKISNVAEMVSKGVSVMVIKSEVEKCIVRCANCHRRRTAKIVKSWRDLPTTIGM